jgi:hypothetical protein
MSDDRRRLSRRFASPELQLEIAWKLHAATVAGNVVRTESSDPGCDRSGVAGWTTERGASAKHSMRLRLSSDGDLPDYENDSSVGISSTVPFTIPDELTTRPRVFNRIFTSSMRVQLSTYHRSSSNRFLKGSS